MPGASADFTPAASGLLLDTTVLIDVLRGRPAVDRLGRMRIGGQRPHVCAISVEELWRGVRVAERPGLERLLDGLRIAPLGRRQGEVAGAWRQRYAGAGITLSQADCLIAAAAVGVGARLATGNPRHFPMPEVVVEHWPVGA